MIIITGINGFIGRSLASAIISGKLRLDPAIASDREVMGYNPFVDFDYDQFQKASDKKNVRIYHLGGTPSPSKYSRNPQELISREVTAMIRVIDLARALGAKLLFSSTCDVTRYFEPWTARAAYVDAKKICEDLCFANSDSVDIKIARLFSTYGPGMKPNDGRVIPEFILRAIWGEPIKIFGGSQMDSFTYIDDMIALLYQNMEFGSNMPVELGNPNLSGKRGMISILELAKTICRLSCSDSKIVIEESDRNFFNRMPDMSYMKPMYGREYQFRFGLEEGLMKTISDMCIRNKKGFGQ